MSAIVDVDFVSDKQILFVELVPIIFPNLSHHNISKSFDSFLRHKRVNLSMKIIHSILADQF